MLLLINEQIYLYTPVRFVNEKVTRTFSVEHSV